MAFFRIYSHQFKTLRRAREAQQVNVLPTKADSMSLSPETLILEGENQLRQIILCPLPDDWEYIHIYPTETGKSIVN